MNPALRIRKDLADQLIRICQETVPEQSFGLLTGTEPGIVDEIRTLKKNLRRTSRIVQRRFEAYGPAYRDPNRGFCFDPFELRAEEERLQKESRHVVAVYHSHRIIPPQPTPVDADMHYSPDALLVIVGVADPTTPAINAYALKEKKFEPIPVELLP
jgi:proteasome lid subunit RPN8/RPN11